MRTIAQVSRAARGSQREREASRDRDSGPLRRVLRRRTGELRDVSGLTINQNTINVFGSPEFAALQNGLLSIARMHPAARGEIIALLRGLDTNPSGLAGGLPSPAGGDGAVAHETAAYGRPGPSIAPMMIECEAADAA
jgi:hypothetical protein